MKNKLHIISLAIVAGVVLSAANQERIRWTWCNRDPILSIKCYLGNDGEIQFGLRNDGVVVWREIKPAVTNSPAEQPELFFGTNQSPPWGFWTNYTLTNIILLDRDGTNETLWRNNGTQQFNSK